MTRDTDASRAAAAVDPATAGPETAGCVRCAALIGALQELSHWPDLPGIPFAVKWEGGEVILRPEQVVGIFRAIERHANSLLPFGVRAVKALHDQDSLRARVATLEARLHDAERMLAELVDTADCTYDHHGYCQAHALHPRPCPHERAKAFLVRATPRGAP